MKRAALLVTLVACGSTAAPPTTIGNPGTSDASEAAVVALQASKFTEAAKLSADVLAQNPANSRAAAVHAVATYQAAGFKLYGELDKIIHDADHLEFFDHAGGRAAWTAFLKQLEAIDKDLSVAAGDPSFSLELCPACWKHDWNHSGTIDWRDDKMFELEYDGKGGELAEKDPRRRPTFRFDQGDADWARAMISFQRAAGELVLAYRWSDLDKLFEGGPTAMTIKLDDKGRVQHARDLVIAGLGFADKCRAEYLTETDDDREWVPNPRQKNHPMPMEVDVALYQLWGDVTADIRRMLNSEEGLSMRELAKVADDDLESRAPAAFVDLGAMLRDPKDITIDLTKVIRSPDAATVGTVLQGVLGNGYKTSMKPSPLVGRLRAMKGQLDRNEDTFERKLRYLIWLN